LRGMGQGAGHRIPAVHLPRPAVAGAQRGHCGTAVPGDAPQGGAAMKLRGTVEFRDVEMGVWVLVGEDGQTYQIAGGRWSLLKEGQRVEIDGEVDDAAVSASMVGPLLRVRSYKVH